MKCFLCALLLGGVLPTVFAQAPPQDIQRWIAELGDSDYPKREEATRQLTALGEIALPALETAILEGDPEVAQRAREITWAITKLSPERRNEIAMKARRAFSVAAYETAARQQMLLARTRRPTVAECIAVGDDWQMANRWAEAVAGYQRALERVIQVLAGDPESDPPPEPLLERKLLGGGGGLRPLNGIRGLEQTPLNEHQVRELAAIRAGLVLMIGRIQKEKLNDPRAAIATFSRIVEMTPEFKGDLPALLPSLAMDVGRRRAKQDVPHDIGRGLNLLNEFDVMEALAQTQEAMGRDEAAILTLARLSSAYLHTRDDGVEDALARMTRLLLKTPAVMEKEGAKALVALTPAPLAPKSARPVAFKNAASPFHWAPTNLDTFGLGSLAVRSLAKLPDGRWVAAITAGSKVYTAATGDGVTWDAPQLLPYNGIANNTDPAMTVDDKGVRWLVWFSNRTSLHPRSSAGYVLWISQSADGKTWSPPRAIAADTGGWPMGRMNWLRTRDGRFRLSWRAAAASAISPGEIAKLQSIDMFAGQRTWPMDPFVSQDDTGRFHLVLDDRLMGLRYANSTDGLKWSDSIVLVEKRENAPSTECPNLLIDGPRVALIYSIAGATWLRRGSLKEIKELGEPVQLADSASPVVGTRWVRMGDDVVGFAAGEHPWILRAPARELFRGR